MSSTASRIDRVRVRAPAGTAPADLASRMRQGLTQWLNQAEAACHTLSPDAIVVVRQVRAPWQALRPGAPAAPTARPQTALATALQGARHGLPGPGATVGAGCPAVWFDNEAEVLAGLAQDALGGTLAQRWWWRQLLGQQVHDEVVLRQWVGAPKHVPQALALLQTEAQGGHDTAWLRHMGAASREALLQALASVFPCDASVLSWVRQGDPGPAQRQATDRGAGRDMGREEGDSAMRLSRLCAVLLQRPHDAADGHRFLVRHADLVAGSVVRSVVSSVAEDRELVHEAAGPLEHPPSAHGPGGPEAGRWGSLQALSGAQALRSDGAATAHEASSPASTASATFHTDAPNTAASRTALDGQAHPPSPGRTPGAAHLPHGERATAPDALQAKPSGHAGAHASLPSATPSPEPGDASAAGTPQAPSPPAGQAARAWTASDAVPDTASLPSPPSAEDATAALAAPRRQVGPVASIGRQATLARHTGSTPDTGWPTGLPHTRPAARTDTAHAGLFFLLNAAVGLGWYGDFTQPQHRGLDLSPWQFLRAAGQALAGPAWQQDALADWLLAMDPTPLPGKGVRPLWAPLRARLSLALGLPRLQATRLTLSLPGQVRLRPGHVGVHIPLAQLPLAVRMAGLDRDIGWLPAAGLDLRFHFEVGSP